jgi:hypothetical protein
VLVCIPYQEIWNEEDMERGNVYLDKSLKQSAKEIFKKVPLATI